MRIKNSANGTILRQKKHIIFRLFRYLLDYKWYMILGFLVSTIGNMLALYAPKILGDAMDFIERGSGNIDLNKVLIKCIFVIIIYLFECIFNYILRQIMISISQNVMFKLRNETFSKLEKLPISYFDSHKTGDLLSRFHYDVEIVGSYLCEEFISLFINTITIIFSIIMMFYISPPLLLLFVCIAPSSILITTVINKKVKPLFKDRTKSLGEMNGFFTEIISGIKAIKVLGQEDSIKENFNKLHNKTLNMHYRSEFYSTKIMPSINLIGNICLSIICMIASLFYLLNKITLGGITSFILYSKKAIGVVNEMSAISNQFQSIFISAERIFNLLDEQEEKDVLNNTAIPIMKGEITFSNVSFGYSVNNLFIKDINLNIKAGERVAIVGKTGAGKSTLINLLLRFYRVTSGEIYLDSYNINDLKRETLRRCYAIVLQDSYFFYGTIYENLIYGNLSLTKQDVINAAKEVNIHNYIMSLKKGYDTILEEETNNISKGQKQLLAIVRAMLLKANILILDEATSNVDSITEQKIEKAMNKLMKNKTCFVIAHRLSTIKNANHILVMDNGCIVEQGKHEQLINLKGYYYSLYKTQF